MHLYWYVHWMNGSIIESFLQLCSADLVSTEVALTRDQLLLVACAYQKAACRRKLGKQVTAVKANWIQIRGATYLVPGVSFYLREFEFRVIWVHASDFFSCWGTQNLEEGEYWFKSRNLHYCTWWFGRRYRPLLSRPIDQHHFLQETEAAIFHVQERKREVNKKSNSCTEKSLPTEQ